MPTREATCHCGQLRLEVSGEPFAVSICNCLACQRRTGSAFGMQAGFRPDQVKIAGRYNDYSRISDEADRKEHVFHFCPECGSQVFYTEPEETEFIVVSVGSFADPSFPPRERDLPSAAAAGDPTTKPQGLRTLRASGHRSSVSRSSSLTTTSARCAMTVPNRRR